MRREVITGGVRIQYLGGFGGTWKKLNEKRATERQVDYGKKR